MNEDACRLAAHWPGIERHPRLVFEKMDWAEEFMVSYYLGHGKPFTVVISPSEKEQHDDRQVRSPEGK